MNNISYMLDEKSNKTIREEVELESDIFEEEAYLDDCYVQLVNGHAMICPIYNIMVAIAGKYYYDKGYSQKYDHGHIFLKDIEILENFDRESVSISFIFILGVPILGFTLPSLSETIMKLAFEFFFIYWIGIASIIFVFIYYVTLKEVYSAKKRLLCFIEDANYYIIQERDRLYNLDIRSFTKQEEEYLLNYSKRLNSIVGINPTVQIVLGILIIIIAQIIIDGVLNIFKKD